jgi:chromosome segregation ATPase
MCKASVTRTTLKDAVREMLVALIEERGGELFSGLEGSQDEQMASASDIAEVKESVAELRAKLDAIESRVGEVDSSFDDRLGVIQLDLTDVRSAVDDAGLQIRDELGIVSERVMEIEEGLGELEESVPETAKAVMTEFEVRLRKEISEMLEHLTFQFGELKEMLSRVEEMVPSRLERLGAEVDQRLGRIEESFGKVSDQVRHLDSTTSEFEGMGTRFKELGERAASAQQELNRNTEGVEEIRTTLGSRLDGLEGVLRQVISRWESDQSEMSQRLGNLRDSLRDQLADFNQQVDDGKGFWSKLRGNKDPGLTLSSEEFCSLSGKLEGIITGLETVISKKKES